MQDQDGRELTRVLRMVQLTSNLNQEHDKKGFFRLEKVCEHLNCSKNALWTYVGYDKAHGKQRYEISGGKIRALNGHFKDLPDLWRDLPAVRGGCYVHGTTRVNAQRIKKEGLIPKSRWIHFAELEDFTRIGRRNAEVLIVLKSDSKAQIRKAKNNVLLCRKSIPAHELKFFDKSELHLI